MTDSKDTLTAAVGQSRLDAGEQGRVLRSAGTVGGITAVSRVSGYLRDLVLAYLLGATGVMTAWVVAFRLPNTLRRLVGEGNVSAAFVPVFSDAAERRDEDDLWRLADAFHASLALVVALLTVAGILLAPWLVRIVAPGLGAGLYALTVDLTRVTFPYLLFISMAAVLMAVLNARDSFAPSAATPILFNLSIVAVALSLWAGGWMEPEWAVAAGALLGGFLQWAFQVPFAWRLGMRFRPALRLGDPALRRTARLMLPGLFGVGITQINVLVGQALATLLPGEGSVPALYYAGRLNELTLGVFAISVATVVLPLMSRQAARGEREDLVDTVNFALRQVTLITLPAAVGLILLRRDIVTVLYEHGAFDAAGTDLTAGALWGYSLGLVAYAAVRILAPGFYALKDTRTPVLFAGAGMVVNIGGCLALMWVLGTSGIALANSLAAAVNATLLLVSLRSRLGTIGGGRLLASVARLGAATAVMAVVLVVLRGALPSLTELGLIAQIGTLALLIGAGVATYVVVVVALRAPELGELRSMLRRRVAGPITPPPSDNDTPGSAGPGSAGTGTDGHRD